MTRKIEEPPILRRPSDESPHDRRPTRPAEISHYECVVCGRPRSSSVVDYHEHPEYGTCSGGRYAGKAIYK